MTVLFALNFTITVRERNEDAVEDADPLCPPPAETPPCAWPKATPRFAAACQFWLRAATSVWLTERS